MLDGVVFVGYSTFSGSIFGLDLLNCWLGHFFQHSINASRGKSALTGISL